MLGASSSSKAILEDEEEHVIYRPPVVPCMTPMVDITIPSTSFESSTQQLNPDADS